jgi:hypothetical protein
MVHSAPPDTMIYIRSARLRIAFSRTLLMKINNGNTSKPMSREVRMIIQPFIKA